MKIDETKNEYRIRIRHPSLFYRKTFRTKTTGRGIKFIVAKLKSKPITAKTKVQSLHFDKSLWTKHNAILWTEKFITKHKIRKSKKHKIKPISIGFFR